MKISHKVFGLSRYIPKRMLHVINRLFFIFSDKYYAEWIFQRIWAPEFSENKHKVLEYWRKYRFFEELMDICQFENNTKSLDIGCGISTVLHFIDGVKTGIDPLADRYKEVYDYPSDIEVISGVAEKLPFENHCFDVVFCTNALDHFTNQQEAVSEIKRVINKGGIFVLTVEIFKREKFRDPAHPHSFTMESINNLDLKGFTLVFQEESDWIGMRDYVYGSKKIKNKELISVWMKTPN